LKSLAIQQETQLKVDALFKEKKDNTFPTEVVNMCSIIFEHFN
jgi:hypothetical protein